MQMGYVRISTLHGYSKLMWANPPRGVTSALQEDWVCLMDDGWVSIVPPSMYKIVTPCSTGLASYAGP